MKRFMLYQLWTAIGLGVSVPAMAQSAEPQVCANGQTQVAVLGMYHFVSTQNVLTQADDDELTPKRQAEIARLVGYLAKFGPDKVLVERPYDQQELDRRYDDYREGSYTLTAEETDQIGFRLARMLGHDRLHYVRYSGAFPLDEVQAFATANGREGEYREALSDAETLVAELERHLANGGIVGALRFFNTDAALLANHTVYMKLNAIGEPSHEPSAKSPGADLVSQWYATNLHLFANIQAQAKDADKMLVIYGQGHAYTLRQFIEADPSLCSVDIGSLLPPFEEGDHAEAGAL